MKVTLRNTVTRHFLSEDGSWVSSGAQARNFGYTDVALSHCAELAQSDVNVCYVFSEAQANAASASGA